MFHTTLLNLTGLDLVLLYLIAQFLGFIVSLVIGALAAVIKTMLI